MKRSDGGRRADYDQNLDEIILDVLHKHRTLNSFRMKEMLNKTYSRKLAWTTINRHMQNLVEQKRVKVWYETEEGKKKIKLYIISAK